MLSHEIKTITCSWLDLKKKYFNDILVTIQAFSLNIWKCLQTLCPEASEIAPFNKILALQAVLLH